MVKAGEIHVWRAAEAASRASLLETALGSTHAVAIGPHGKPYLPGMPCVKFNISRTRGMALIAVAMDVEVGVDVERLRTIPEWREIAAKYFPRMPVRDEREFFRQWTRLEAQVKARGVGLTEDPEACPVVEELDAGEEYAAAVAATVAGMAVKVEWNR